MASRVVEPKFLVGTVAGEEQLILLLVERSIGELRTTSPTTTIRPWTGSVPSGERPAMGGEVLVSIIVLGV